MYVWIMVFNDPFIITLHSKSITFMGCVSITKTQNGTDFVHDVTKYTLALYLCFSTQLTVKRLNNILNSRTQNLKKLLKQSPIIE